MSNNSTEEVQKDWFFLRRNSRVLQSWFVYHSIFQQTLAISRICKLKSCFCFKQPLFASTDLPPASLSQPKCLLVYRVSPFPNTSSRGLLAVCWTQPAVRPQEIISWSLNLTCDLICKQNNCLSFINFPENLEQRPPGHNMFFFNYFRVSNFCNQSYLFVLDCLSGITFPEHLAYHLTWTAWAEACWTQPAAVFFNL